MNPISCIRLSIPITPRTKKNSQRICRNPRTGAYFIKASVAYEHYEKDCRFFMKKLDKPIDYPINLKCIFYMKERRRVDLVNLQEAICDILVKYNILKDDNRNIVASMDGSRVFYDKKNPRTEIEITKLENYESWQKK